MLYFLKYLCFEYLAGSHAFTAAIIQTWFGVNHNLGFWKFHFDLLCDIITDIMCMLNGKILIYNQVKLHKPL